MAQHLSDQDIEDIVQILNYWPLDEKLTWELLCKAIELQLDFKTSPTRQTLQKFVRIKNAYKQVKKPSNLALEGMSDNKLPASLKIAKERITTLELEKSALKIENNQLLSQFEIWQYNAHKYGLSIDQLNEPLPKK